MSIPVLKKTWQFNTNQRILWSGGSDNTNQETISKTIIFNLKNALSGWSSGSWTVVGSSNGTAWGLDGVDRWTTTSALVNGSWIVLKQTGLWNGNVQLLIHFDGGLPYIDARLSPHVGFTGGGATTKPTASDSYGVGHYANESLTFQYVNYVDHNIHVMQSTDGKNLIFFTTAGGRVSVFCQIAEFVGFGLKNMHVLWQTEGQFWYGNYCTSPNGGFNVPVTMVSGTIIAKYTSEYFAGADNSAYNLSTQYGGVMNQVSQEYQLSKLGLIASRYQSMSIRGYLGSLDDVYLGPLYMPIGTSYPVSSSGQPGDADRLVQLAPAPIVVPWSGSLFYYA